MGAPWSSVYPLSDTGNGLVDKVVCEHMTNTRCHQRTSENVAPNVIHHMQRKHLIAQWFFINHSLTYCCRILSLYHLHSCVEAYIVWELTPEPMGSVARETAWNTKANSWKEETKNLRCNWRTWILHRIRAWHSTFDASHNFHFRYEGWCIMA